MKGLCTLDQAWIFALALLVRFAWHALKLIPYQAAPDFTRYDQFSSNILQGNFNLDSGSFITAPLFSYVSALFKLLFEHNYLALGVFQSIISSLGVVFLAAAAGIIFRKRVISQTVGVIYSFYLPCLYFTYLPSQESLFQSLFVISFYFACSYNVTRSLRALILFSLFFTLAALTKSHVNLMIPAFLLMITATGQLELRRRLLHALLACSIFLSMTMPYGIFNLKLHNTYVMTSSGMGAYFLFGHNNDYYTYVINTPPKGSPEFERIKSMNYQILDELGPKLNNQSDHKSKQKTMLDAGLKWTLDNPIKTLHLVIHNLKNYLLPGYSPAFFASRDRIVMLTFTTPILLLSYLGLFRAMRKSIRDSLPALCVLFDMFIFVTVFYGQNRFRVITVEPIYIVYASYEICFLAHKLRKRVSL